MRPKNGPGLPTALACTLLAAAMCGCKTGELENKLDDMERRAAAGGASFISGDFASADAVFAGLALEPTVSAPLYRLDRIPCLIFAGKEDDAYGLMRSVRTELEELYDTESEERALSRWHGEINKVFKGSPHEMAAFYALMSLSCAKRGDYEDAWRCVQNGLLHDSDSADEKYQSDDALLLYLGSVFARKAGETDSAAQCRTRLAEALAARGLEHGKTDKRQKSAYAALLDERAPDPNALVVFWTGTPPQYGRAGKYGETRTILKGRESAADFITVSVDGGAEKTVPQKVGDVNYQATTRGGREMDGILANKADFKQDMKNFQTVSIGISGFFFAAAAATLDSSKEMLIVSGSLAAMGVAFLVVDGVFYHLYDKTDPRADTRTWKTLPGQLNILPLHLAPGEHEIKARACIGGDALAQVSLKVDAPGDGRMAVAHVFCMGDTSLARAEKLCNNICATGNSSAPKTPVLHYPAIAGSWNTSACYAITGTDPSASRFRLKDQSMPFPLWNAMIRHQYLRHWSAAGVMAGLLPPRPDRVLTYTGSYWSLADDNGRPVLDTRVAVAVRGSGEQSASGAFESGPVRFFYAWSRTSTDKTAIGDVTSDEKQAGVDAALDNLFKIREFREALQPGAMSLNRHPAPGTAKEDGK